MNRKGFTLIELLAVMAIIGILTSLVIGVSSYASRKAAESRAIADMEKLRNALEEYKIEFGAYPLNGTFTNANTMVALSNFVSDITFEDPWGNGYTYTLDSGKFSYYLKSGGQDQDSTSDDLRSDKGYK